MCGYLHNKLRIIDLQTLCRSEKRFCQVFLYWSVLGNPKCYCIPYLSVPKVATVSLRPGGQKRNSEVRLSVSPFWKLGAFRKKCSFSFVLAGWAEIAQGRQQPHHQTKKNRTAPTPYGCPRLPAVPGQSRRAWNPSCPSPCRYFCEREGKVPPWVPAVEPGTLGFLSVLFFFPVGWYLGGRGRFLLAQVWLLCCSCPLLSLSPGRLQRKPSWG